MSITVDTAGFEKALHQSLLSTKRDLPAVLNGHAIAVITKAAALTPKTDKGSIPYKLYSEVANSRGEPTSILYLILNARQKGKGLNNNAMRTAASKLIGRRVASIGFNAWAGWNNALIAMGGRGFGKARNKGFSRSTAAAGRGERATVANLMASLSNTATWIEHIGVVPLQQALNTEEAKMLKHIDDKLQKHCAEASR